MLAMIVLPITAFLLLSATSRRLLRRAGLPDDWSAGMVAAGLLLCGLVVMLTELLSLVSMVRTWPMTLAWGVLVASLGIFMLRDRASLLLAEEQPEARTLANDDPDRMRPTGWRRALEPGLWVWTIVGMLLLFTLVVAICKPPNQHDALGYHLPRQLMWMDLGSVSHYATEDLREVQFPPLAEYLQMHTMLLTGSDLWVQLTSWWVYALSVLAAGLLCRAIGARSAAPLAALLVACQPSMFILSTTPKNDPLLTFSVLALAWLAFECLARRRCGVFAAILIGLSLGVGGATKTSAAFFMLPISIVIAMGFFICFRLGAFWRGGIIAVVALLLVSGYAWRNFETFGSALGPMSREDGGFGLSMERHDPVALMSTVVRHAASHLPLRDHAAARAAEDMVRDLHDRMGWDVDDPKTTWLARYSHSENIGTLSIVPAPAHVLLLMAFPVIMLVRAALGGSPRARNGLVCLVWACALGGLLLYVVMVKWQVWQLRLHAPSLALAAVPAAIAVWPSRQALLQCLAIALVGLPTLAFAVWAGIPHTKWPNQGLWAALTHPRHPSLRWHPTEAIEYAERQLAVLEDVDFENMAIVGWNTQYNIMRFAQRVQPDVRFTSVFPTIGRTGQPPAVEWVSPDVFVTDERCMSYARGPTTAFRRVGQPGCLNIYVATDHHPDRPHGEAIMGMAQYQAFDAFGGGVRFPRASANYRFNISGGLLIPGRGVDLQLPDNRVPRTLLMSLNPVGLDSREVVVLLDDQELARFELEPFRYTLLEVPVRPIHRGQGLKIRFPQSERAPVVAAVGWAQLPTSGHLNWYDQSRAGQPFDPPPEQAQSKTPTP